MILRASMLVAPLTVLAAVLLIAVGIVVLIGDPDAPNARDPSRAEQPDQRAFPRPVLREGGVGPRLRLLLVERFRRPLLVTQAPGDRSRLFVVEQGGRVRVVRDGRKLARPFLSVRGEVSGDTEQGLLGLAFAPDYQRSGRLYVSYTTRTGDLVVVEYRASSPDRAPRRGRRVIMRIPQPEPTHNGGNVVFGPDRMLYVGLGDGGGPGDPRRWAQDLSTPHGSILRIDPRGRSRTRFGRYAIPRDNPLRGRPDARPEIFAYGLRNPWRFSFDRRTGALLVGDVGQETREEVSYRPAGRARGTNFGWSAFEGRLRYNRDQRAPRHVPPIHDYGRRFGCSITGGYVMRDPEIPAMRGRYVFADFCLGEIHSLVPRGPRARDVRSERLRVPLANSFGEDLDGRVYVTSQQGGVYRLVAR